MLSQSYPNHEAARGRSHQRCNGEVIGAVLTELASVLREDLAFHQSECYSDASVVSARGGGDQFRSTKRGKGMKFMMIVDRHGQSSAVATYAASSREVMLVQLTFDFRMIEAHSEGLFGARTAPFRSRLQEDPRFSTAAPLRAMLDRRELLRLDFVKTSTACAPGVPRNQFSRLRAACGAVHSAQAALR